MKIKYMIATLAVAASVGAFTVAGVEDASARTKPEPLICPPGETFVPDGFGGGWCVPLPRKKCWWTCPRELGVVANVGAFAFPTADDASARMIGETVPSAGWCLPGEVFIRIRDGSGGGICVPPAKCWWTCPRKSSAQSTPESSMNATGRKAGGEQMEDLPLAPPKCWWTCPRKSSGQGTGGIADATTAPEEPVAPPTANDPTDAPKPEAAPSPLPARTATEPMSASQD